MGQRFDPSSLRGRLELRHTWRPMGLFPLGPSRAGTNNDLVVCVGFHSPCCVTIGLVSLCLQQGFRTNPLPLRQVALYLLINLRILHLCFT